FRSFDSSDRDAHDAALVTACGHSNEPTVVGAAAPSLAAAVPTAGGVTVTNAAPAPLGTVVHDTAQLTQQAGSTTPITGQVTYSFFTTPNNHCTTPATSTQTVTITAGNVVPDSAATAALGTGSYSY